MPAFQVLVCQVPVLPFLSGCSKSVLLAVVVADGAMTIAGEIGDRDGILPRLRRAVYASFDCVSAVSVSVVHVATILVVVVAVVGVAQLQIGSD